MRRGRIAVAFVVAGLAIVACQVVAGIERVDKVPPEPEASGPADPCVHVGPPPPPAVEDGPDVPPFYIAVKTVSVSGKDPGLGFSGFDLDKTCTCERRRGTANDGGSSCKPPPALERPDCDEDGGVDNAAGEIFGAASAGTGISVDTSVTADIEDGKQTVLFFINEYNGTPDDPRVKVGVVPSLGISDGSGCGTEQSTAVHFRPGWCGKDKWDYPREGIVLIAGVPIPADSLQRDAYVSGGRLVFRGPEPLRVIFGGALLGIGGAVTVARIERSADAGNRWTMTGLIGGRVVVDQLLGALGQSANPEGRGQDSDASPYLCKSPFWAAVPRVLCDGRDIMGSVARDFAEESCDALSTAIAFAGEEAELGSVREPEPNDNPCAPENGQDASIYVCPVSAP